MSTKTTQKRGVALGAVFALFASLFISTPASAAPSTDAFTITPASGTSFKMLVDEDFTLVVARNTSVVSATDFDSYLKYSITTNRAANVSTYAMTVLAKAEASGAPVAVSSSGVTYLDGVSGTPGYTAQRIYYNTTNALNGNVDNQV